MSEMDSLFLVQLLVGNEAALNLDKENVRYCTVSRTELNDLLLSMCCIEDDLK